MKVFRLLFAAIAVGTVVSANAAIRIFCGLDAVQFPSDPRPNSNAAYAQFVVTAASVNSISVANFDELEDGLKTGPIASNASIASVSNQNEGVNSNDDIILGFNTSQSAGKHYRVGATNTSEDVVVTFNFDDPINAFGAFFTGVGTAASETYIEWTNNQGVQKLTLQELSGGSVQFCGFTDIGNTFTEVKVIMARQGGFVTDVMGIDDLTYSDCNPVPEPGTMAALAIGALVALRRRKK